MALPPAIGYTTRVSLHASWEWWLVLQLLWLNLIIETGTNNCLFSNSVALRLFWICLIALFKFGRFCRVSSILQAFLVCLFVVDNKVSKMSNVVRHVVFVDYSRIPHLRGICVRFEEQSEMPTKSISISQHQLHYLFFTFIWRLLTLAEFCSLFIIQYCGTLRTYKRWNYSVM